MAGYCLEMGTLSHVAPTPSAFSWASVHRSPATQERPVDGLLD